uniref:Uncharacterized protein n=1 Tax=Marseillevirus LCMAC103 TaxID=2506604 RepID=A0A481YWZ2_9VIRU|nr:MAG: uncharacterized protein LCMAC103_03900 [Marseillevirus LCMAC103]
MSNFVSLVSTHRDREQYANPAEYTVKAGQVATWFRSARRVRAHPQNPATQSLDFVSTVNVKHVITPWCEAFSGIPQLYMDFHSDNSNDMYLVGTIDGRNRDARFVLVQFKIQTDHNGAPQWIHWKCEMEQTLRYKRDGEASLRLFTEDGVTLPIVDAAPPLPADPTKQTFVLFEITPYSRDGDYDNHLLTYLSNA